MHTLSDATRPIGQIHPFSQIAVTFYSVLQFIALCDLECLKPVQHSLFYNWKSNFKLFARASAFKLGEEKDHSVYLLIMPVFVELHPGVLKSL